ncbi:hypothetical protein [Tropicibacter naphthalenivorans]|uniref:Antifreeze protein n=1 Tax=Tropicibacter naphthalenivorans TaxID=441103 RepID=A0A0P1G1C8_9RHOB|nr:hypothetical protein [Tropicibacter naphthalenivorans]CUH75327.1 hypothetical protein TRN7648_00382 [Tropicibacter naphthalenivorans]SMC45068.1 hypothetical protein SAMN04488093_101497 [Tropicibacter naphthalenivorans]
MGPSYDWSDPFRMFKAQAYIGAMAMEAGAVIWMRMLGMGGMWMVPRTENARMVSEKQTAFYASGHKAMVAAMKGKPADVILMEAARPLRRKTSANHKRLTKLGPRKL